MAITKVTEGVRTLGTGEVATANMATDPTNASNLSSGSVPTAQLGNVDTTTLEDDIAILGFKVATNGSLAKYNLVDQTEDAFEDASGIDTSTSTNEILFNNYFTGGASPTATGGTITTDGDYTVHKFTASGDYVNDTAQNVEYLVIGGGGAGGRINHAAVGGGGGGGGGGVREGTGFAVAATTIAVTVGAGGTAVTSGGVHSGDTGGDSVFSTITGAGGGYGGHTNDGPPRTGGDGGSGGGSAARSPASGEGSGNTPVTSPVQGYDGGSGSTADAGGGGGGWSEVGADGSASDTGGTGGDGAASDIIENGTDVLYAGGGAGGNQSGGGQAGGTGGGGNSGGASNSGVTAGTDGLGGGGGGAGQNGNGQDGGDGLVVIRRLTSFYNNMTLVSNSTTAEAVPTKGDIVMTYTNGIGTATINTDLKAYISRDNGTTYTQVTLADQGDTGGHTILTAHDLDISSQPSGSAMRYKIETLNQSASKETRIQAVSLGWS